MKPLELDPDVSHLRNAYHLGRIAHAVYSDDPVEFCPPLGTFAPKVIPFSCGSVFGAVFGNGEDVVIAFRGTDATQEWLEAVSYQQVSWPGPGRAHKGIAAALESVWQPLMAGLFDVEGIEKRIWLTGHSLGGSLATLATLRLAHDGFEPHMTTSYGSPRVVDAVAACSAATAIYRFVNNEDTVPDFPWPTLLDTYVHAGEAVFLLASGAIGEARHSAGLARRIDRAKTIGQGTLQAGPIYDHFMTSYLAKLARHGEAA